MATSVNGSPNPDASTALIQALLKGGVSVAAVSLTAPGTVFIAPQDEGRSYIAFSLTPGSQPMRITPQDSMAPNGFVISDQCPNLEFGGNVVAAMVQGRWFATGTLADQVSVTVIRNP